MEAAWRAAVAAAAAAGADDRARAAAVAALHRLLGQLLPLPPLPLPHQSSPALLAAVLMVCAEPHDASRGLDPAVVGLAAAAGHSAGASAEPLGPAADRLSAARERLALLAALPPRCLFALSAAVLAALPAEGDGALLLWGPLRTLMADAGGGTGLLGPGHPIPRKERAEALALWFGKAARAVRAAEPPPAVDSAAAILHRWLDECDGQAAAASAGNAAAHLPNVLQARLLRGGVAFAAALDTCPGGEGAVQLVLEMLGGRALGLRTTLDAWAASVAVLGTHGKPKSKPKPKPKPTPAAAAAAAAAAPPASVLGVAPSLASDLIHFITSGGGDANGLSGPAARLLAQLLSEEHNSSKAMPPPQQQPTVKACGDGLGALCSALLQDEDASSRGRLCAAVIGPLCKSASAAVATLLDTLLQASAGQGLGSALEVASAARNAGGKAAALVLERLQIDVLDGALVHASEGLRVAALKFCCQVAAVVPRRKAPKSSLDLSTLLPMLRRRMRYCAYGMGNYGASRQRHDDVINAVGLLLRQLHITIIEGLDNSSSSTVLLKPTVVEWARTVAEWCGWLRTWLFARLCPGAPFSSVSLTLAILHEHASLFWKTKQQLPTDHSDAVQQRVHLLDIACGQRSLEAVRWEMDTLCLLLESTYPRIRELAYDVLLQLDVPLSMPHPQPGLPERGRRLMTSVRLRQFDAGALLVRLLHKRHCEGGWWSAEVQGCTCDKLRAMNPTDGLVVYTRWAFDGGDMVTTSHGLIRCLRYVLTDYSFDLDDSDEHAWSTPVGQQIATICAKGFTSLKLNTERVKVLCERKATPSENSTLLSGPTDLSTDAQMANSVLEVAEVCRLMGTLSQKLGFCRDERSEGLKLSHCFVDRCLQELLSAMLILPHMGAISAIAETLEGVLAKLLYSDGCMARVVNWREVLLENLSGPRILRRSTGMTTAVMALLRPLASRSGSSKQATPEELHVGTTIRYLLEVAAATRRPKTDSSQVAALDALTFCFRHRGIMIAAQTDATASGNDLLPKALHIAVIIQSSTNWAAQNSAAQLFDAVAQRLAGDGGLQVGNTEDSRTVTLASCLSAHPHLEVVLLELMESMETESAKYHLLLFVGLFKPAESSHDHTSQVGQAKRLLAFIEQCSANRSFRLREAAAAALAALVPVEALPDFLAKYTPILTGRQQRSTNYTHGLWLQVLSLVRSTRVYAKDKAHHAQTALLPLLNQVHGIDPLSRKVPVDIVHEFEVLLNFEPGASADCVDAAVSDIIFQSEMKASTNEAIGLNGLSKRLAVTAI